jgi:murein L,D-transpeptidase YafK
MIKKAILATLLFVVIFIFSYNFFAEKGVALDKNIAVDSLCILKSKRALQVFSKGKILKTYDISLGLKPEGDKQFEGDMKTPEGLYSINDKKPNSHFYKNLGVSYPNEQDVLEAAALGKSVGKDIKIHGLGTARAPLGKLHLWMDWTAGCMAITNDEIEELYEVVAVGTPILILP